ncbi:MAG: hypothetical protein M1834_003428 [Cirrosporium novae-zelandiae]|nr:MAG: hypothetical protein M1834_003428 [Cirrosporium novae-zelandiae]
MADPSAYSYPWPLDDSEKLAPLPNERNDDGKSYYNPPAARKSTAYEEFQHPISNSSRGGFDAHIYFFPRQIEFAAALWERIRREFPELRIYQVWEKPVGPHPIGMFEVNIFSPSQFGAFISWLVINRGPLSVLVHPNTDEEERDHSQRATWMGEKIPLDLSLFKTRRDP